jgi:hypothetical protein
MAVDTAAAPLLTLDEAAAMLLCPDPQGPAVVIGAGDAAR